MAVKKLPEELPYPRRRLIRSLMQRGSRLAFALLSNLEVIGRENMPQVGPLIVVANHFSYLDPALMVDVVPWPLEFLGGFQMIHAPKTVTWIPKLWGFFPVFRGSGARGALRAAESVLKRNGILGIYPEAGNWATVLRPARPGTAFLAARSGARLLPMGFSGLPNLFPHLLRGRRAKVTARIGKPFGPFRVTGRGRERRRQLDEIGHEIMRHIAELIPPEKRGHYSDDPALRAAAQGTEVYPWDEHPPG